MTVQPSAPLSVPDLTDPTDHLGLDDRASLVEQQALAHTLAGVRRAAGLRLARPGTCANCGERCLPVAVYCDADCQADHERRQRALAVQGRAA